MGTIVVVIVIVHHRPRGQTERPSRLHRPLFWVATQMMPSQQVPSAAFNGTFVAGEGESVLLLLFVIGIGHCPPIRRGGVTEDTLGISSPSTSSSYSSLTLSPPEREEAALSSTTASSSSSEEG